MPEHNHYMKHAIALGARHQGRTGVNPSVGCLLVRDDKIIGRGITAPGGRPHAEINALNMAGKLAKDATAYVTLEPCAHEGATPSCARILTEADVREVVIAVEDPDPRTSGKGCEILKQAGITIISGIETDAAKETLMGFLTCQKKGRPYYQLKMGVSADFKIAEKRGIQSDITGPVSRKYAMLLRSKCDGILVGIDTVMSDDPNLTVRLEGLEHTSPTRIVLDREGRLPLNSNLVKTADEVPVILCVSPEFHQSAMDKFQGTKIRILESGKSAAGIDLNILSRHLADLQLGKIMIEGGARIASSFFAEGLIDEIALFQSEKSYGEGALNAIESEELSKILNKYKIRDVKNLGLDTFTLYKKNKE